MSFSYIQDTLFPPRIRHIWFYYISGTSDTIISEIYQRLVLLRSINSPTSETQMLLLHLSHITFYIWATSPSMSASITFYIWFTTPSPKSEKTSPSPPSEKNQLLIHPRYISSPTSLNINLSNICENHYRKLVLLPFKFVGFCRQCSNARRLKYSLSRKIHFQITSWTNEHFCPF